MISHDVTPFQALEAGLKHDSTSIYHDFLPPLFSEMIRLLILLLSQVASDNAYTVTLKTYIFSRIDMQVLANISPKSLMDNASYGKSLPKSRCQSPLDYKTLKTH